MEGECGEVSWVEILLDGCGMWVIVGKRERSKIGVE
jgi:hypothetical protein